MQPRKLILAVLAGGPALGLLMGLAAHPSMTPAPEPAWRSAQPDPIFTEPKRIVETGPQDLSPTWDVDHTPTWKRHVAERQAVAWRDTPEPAYEPPAEAVEAPETRMAEEAAAQQDSAADARSGAEAEAAAQGDTRDMVFIPSLSGA